MSIDTVGKHPGNILIETAAGDVAAALDLNAAVLESLESLYIDPGGSKECFSEGLTKFVVILLQ